MRHALAGLGRAARPAGSGRVTFVRRVRVLFGCVGWPSGVLEIASWATHRDLADAVIAPLLPGLAFRLDAVDRQYLAAGPVHAELAESFALHGSPLDRDSEIACAGRGVWELYDRRHSLRFRIQEADGALEVSLPDRFERPEYGEAIRRLARSRAQGGRLLAPDGSLAAEARQALIALGGPLVLRLIEFRPHVVGRRVEAGQMDEVRQFVRAVRLFSDAEVVLGGPTATSHPIDVLLESGADYVFAGEAEEPFERFLRLAWVHNSRDQMPEIPGLAYCYAGRACHNTLPSDGYERTALDEPGLASPAARRCLRDAVRPVAPQHVVAANRLDWSLLQGFTKEFESLYFTGGRGCPGACTFCAKLHGPEVRVKSAAQLMEEIEAADAGLSEGQLRVARWELFRHVDDPALQHRLAAWAALYDEDFFLDRRRAVEFFGLWEQSLVRDRYRLSVQTNPCSLLDAQGKPHAELLRGIDRLKPMIQLGAESFHPDLLRRWHKRHTAAQLRTVLDALDATRQDYSVFILLSDFDSTPEEVVEALRLLALEAFGRRRMRIASSPFTIPLYDSDTRRALEYGGLLSGPRVRHFTDFERPQPGWMDPLAAELADRADAELRFALNLPQRDGALMAAMEAVLECIVRQEQSLPAGPCAGRRARIAELKSRAQWGIEQLKESRFRGIEASRFA